MIDRKVFFDAVRKAPFGGSISQKAVKGCNAILDEWEKRGLTDRRWLAYMLATAYHETAHTMQPIAEYGKGKGRKYGVKGKHGQVAYGRGYVQLTWDYNYERADKELGLNGALTKNYEMALDPAIAAEIMFAGMIEGWFTGKKLSDYINSKTDFRNARRIINGVDKAAMIAGYASDFLAALEKAYRPGGVAEPAKPVAPVPPAPEPVPAPPIPVEPVGAPEPAYGLPWWVVVGGFLAVAGGVFTKAIGVW
jgi:putative chitinase